MDWEQISKAAYPGSIVLFILFILWAMTFSKRLGPSGPAWFLAGLALVYSALVSWGLTADQTPG